MQPKVAKEYRAKLTLHNDTIVSITSSDEKTLRTTVQDLVLGQRNLPIAQKSKPVRFEEQQGTSTFIFHESYLEGSQPLGWVSEYDVPEQMSVRNITEQRQAAQRAA